MITVGRGKPRVRNKGYARLHVVRSNDTSKSVCGRWVKKTWTFQIVERLEDVPDLCLLCERYASGKGAWGGWYAKPENRYPSKGDE